MQIEIIEQSDEYVTEQAALLRTDENVGVRVSFVGAPDYLAAQRRKMVTDVSTSIVRAVNNHEALVTALNKAERLLTFLDGSGNNDPSPDRAYVSKVRRECLAALAAAEVK